MRPDPDNIGHALTARTMPPHLRDAANFDVPPRAFRPIDDEPGLVGDVICPGPVPAGRREGAGRIVARRHGTAASGRPVIRRQSRCGRGGNRSGSDEAEMKK